METDKHYLKVGLFVLLGFAAIACFTLWMTGPHDKSNYATYRIRFADSVNGLDVGGAVKFRGVGVGKVESIIIDPTDSRLIRVDVSILKTTPIKTDTVASLKLQGITGAVFVELSGGDPGSPDLARNGNRIPEIPSKANSIDALVSRLPDILDKVSTIADQVAKLFSDQNVAAIGELAQNLNRTATELNTLITHTSQASGGQYQQLYQALDEMKKTSRDVGELARSLKEDPSRIIAPTQQKGIPAP